MLWSAAVLTYCCNAHLVLLCKHLVWNMRVVPIISHCYLLCSILSLQQGVIVAGGEEYLIEPLVSPDNQTKTERGERAEGRPHVVYKRSSLRHQYKGQSCGVIGEMRRYSGLFISSSVQTDLYSSQLCGFAWDPVVIGCDQFCFIAFAEKAKMCSERKKIS